MLVLVIVLAVLLVISLVGNGLLWYRWHSYRAKPAGDHSWTGIMPVVRPDD